MPPKPVPELPTPIMCSAPDCEYTTPTGLPTYDLITQHLQIHAQIAHAAVQGPGNRAPQQCSQGGQEAEARGGTGDDGARL